MAYVGMGPEVSLPSLMARPWGRFIQVVPEVKIEAEGKDRTASGAVYMAPAAYSPIVVDYSCSSTDTKTGNWSLTSETQAGVLLVNLLECSSLTGGQERLTEYTDEAFEIILSEALTMAATGQRLSTSHMTLWDDSTILPTGANITEVVTTIEDGLADRLSNQQGYIFISPRNFAPAKAAGLIYRDDNQLFSPMGHKIVVDAGHGFDNWVFGTGAMGWAIQRTDGLTPPNLDRVHNDILWLKEAYAVILFNPNHSVRAATTGVLSD